MKSDFVPAPWEPTYIQENNPDDVRLKINELRGLWIPGEILFNEDLTWMEKGLLTYIYHLDGPKHCYASNKYLGDLMRCDAKTIANVISMLRKKGFIKTVSWNGRTRKLRVTDKIR